MTATPKRRTKKTPEKAPPLAQPFLKWAGGKRKLVPRILEKAPKTFETFYEPFTGGGAVFFAMLARRMFQRAVLNDLNKDLIETYQVVQSEAVHDLVALLKTYQYSREFYDHLRRIVPSSVNSKIVRAARFIYLNRTGYNGLYRVNLRGEFNVPFGKYANPTICDEEGLMRVHRALQGIELVSMDFEASVAQAGPQDFVYFDPPYLPLSETSCFTAYTSGGFPLTEHQRLARTFYRLGKSGVPVLLSNSTARHVRTLYSQEPALVQEVEAPRPINSKAEKRGLIKELLISIGL